MASIIGSNSIDDRLILHFDAANIKSFRGEPTTNFIKTNGWNGDGTNQTFAAKGSQIITNDSLKYKKMDTVLWTPGSSLNCYLNGSSPLYFDQTSTVWTFSCYIKREDGGILSDTTVGVYVYNMGSNTGNGTVSDEGNGWYRVSRTVSGGNNYVSLVGFYNLIAGHKYYLSGFQLEKKPYPTNVLLIDTTRGTTVDSGGGVVDLSLNSKHAEFNNGPLYNSLNNGSIIMDGINDVLLVNQNITNSTQCTVVMWLASTDTQFLWGIGNNGSYYFGASVGGGNYYNSNCGSPTYHIDTKQVLNPNGYLDNKFHMFEAKGVNLSTWTKLGFLDYGSGSWNMNGKVAMIQVYDKVLTAQESIQNYNTNKNRFI